MCQCKDTHCTGHDWSFSTLKRCLSLRPASLHPRLDGTEPYSTAYFMSMSSSVDRNMISHHAVPLFSFSRNVLIGMRWHVVASNLAWSCQFGRTRPANDTFARPCPPLCLCLPWAAITPQTLCTLSAEAVHLPFARPWRLSPFSLLRGILLPLCTHLHSPSFDSVHALWHDNHLIITRWHARDANLVVVLSTAVSQLRLWHYQLILFIFYSLFYSFPRPLSTLW